MIFQLFKNIHNSAILLSYEIYVTIELCFNYFILDTTRKFNDQIEIFVQKDY